MGRRRVADGVKAKVRRKKREVENAPSLSISRSFLSKNPTLLSCHLRKKQRPLVMIIYKAIRLQRISKMPPKQKLRISKTLASSSPVCM